MENVNRNCWRRFCQAYYTAHIAAAPLPTPPSCIRIHRPATTVRGGDAASRDRAGPDGRQTRSTGWLAGWRRGAMASSAGRRCFSAALPSFRLRAASLITRRSIFDAISLSQALIYSGALTRDAWRRGGQGPGRPNGEREITPFAAETGVVKPSLQWRRARLAAAVKPCCRCPGARRQEHHRGGMPRRREEGEGEG